MANFTIPPLNTNPEDDKDYDLLAQTMIAEKRRKAAEVANVLAQSRGGATPPAADTPDYTEQLNALAKPEYEMNPQLKEYITSMRSGKSEAAANEKKQNSIYNTLDTLNNIRANEWGFKNVNIGDSGDTAQKADVASEAAVNAVGLKDLTGHIDHRRAVAEALARKRGDSFNPKSTGMVTKDGVPVMLSGRDEQGNLLLTTPDNRRVTDAEVMPSSVYANIERNKIVTPKQTEDITGVDSIIKELEKAKLSSGKIDTGPIADFRNRMAQKVGIDDPEVSTFRATVGELVADFIKSKTGATASEPERAFLLANQPNMRDNDETFDAKLERSLTKIKELRERSLENMSNAGKDVANFQSQPTTQAPAQQPIQVQQATPQNDTVIINTPKGRKTVPKADLDRYLKAGATLAE